MPDKERNDKMNREELIREIRRYRCADLSDAMDALGLVDRGTMNDRMRPLRPGMEFKGVFLYRKAPSEAGRCKGLLHR